MSQTNLEAEKQRISDVRDAMRTNISTIRNLEITLDSVTTYYPFRTSGRYVGAYESYGGTISDSDKLFYSQREPIVTWFVSHVAKDIFDNWFRVYNPEDPKDDALDDAVQVVLKALKAKKELIRLITFERRYGMSIMLCAYAGFNEENWATPLYEVNEIGEKQLKDIVMLLQITPYSKTGFTVKEKEESQSNIRLGLPTVYGVKRGEDTGDTDVNWTRVIHAATRLDEHQYEGVSIIDPLFDDAVGYRNSKWGQYQTIYRHGSGFPHYMFPGATKKEIEDWYAAGGADQLNARMSFASGEDGENIEFKGAQTTALDPSPYNDMAFMNMAMATRIPQDILKGVSAGRVTGSQVNERNYFKFISGEQTLIEPIVRELIDRIIDTGQAAYADRRRGTISKDYEIEWYNAFQLNDVDEARIKLWNSTATKNELEYKTVDEVRDDNELPPLPDGEGEVVLGVKRVEKAAEPFGGAGGSKGTLGKSPEETIEDIILKQSMEGFEEDK